MPKVLLKENWVCFSRFLSKNGWDSSLLFSSKSKQTEKSKMCTTARVISDSRA